MGDGVIAGYRWPQPDKPPILFLHATGFCASAYRRMFGALSGRFDIHALDLRGHGKNTRPADPSALSSLRKWTPFIEDAAAYLDQSGRKDWILAGHSMGAVVSLLAAKGRDDVAALRLIEPVAMPAWMNIAAKTPLWPFMAARLPIVRGAARRRCQWPSREEVLASYAGKPIFKVWAPGVLEDYLEDGLEPEGAGVRLCCEPAWEAATFAAQANDFWAAVASSGPPLSIYAADHQWSTVSPAARDKLKRAGAEVMLMKGAGHLAPMELPERLAAFVAGDPLNGLNDAPRSDKGLEA